MYSFYTLSKKLKYDTNLVFQKKIEGDNAQGSCGLLSYIEQEEKSKDNDELDLDSQEIDCRELIINYKTNTVFYKYGSTGDNCTLSRQEYIIAESLKKECSHFPNFLRSILYIKNHFIRNDKCADPFDISSFKHKSTISCVDVVLFEYIQKHTTFCKIMKNKKLDPEIKNSLILQILLAILSAQKNAEFVHNDLHGNNILIVKCDKNLKILYRINILGKETLFFVPTFGLIPIIIDYGFSYSKECENMSLECADLDNFGLITYQFDSLSDFIRLFVVLTNSHHNEKLRSDIFYLLKNLPISMKKSWEDNIIKEYSMYSIEKLFLKVYGQKKYESNQKYADQILRLMTRSILLPIKNNPKYKNVDVRNNLKIFLENWNNINKWLKYEYEKVFVLREFVDSIRKYGNLDGGKIYSILKKNIYEICGKKFPLDLDMSIILSSYTNTIGGFQNMLFDNIKNLTNLRQEKLYKRLKSGEYMFSKVVDSLYETKNSLTSNDIILLIDDIDKKNIIIEPQQEETFVSNEETIYNLFMNK